MAYLAPDTIGGGPYLAPDEPPIGPTPPPSGSPNLYLYTIMRASTINLSAPIAASLNLTGNLL